MNKKTQNVLGEALLKRKMISQEAWEGIIKIALSGEEDIISLLAKNGLISEKQVLGVLSEELQLKYSEIKNVMVDKAVIEKIPIRIAFYYKFMPLAIKNKVLTVAVSEPLDIQTQDEIRTHLGYGIEMVLAPKEDILEALKKFYGVGAQTLERIASTSGENAVLREAKEESVENIEELAEDASVIKLVNEIILEAYKKRATDIHIEPYRKDVNLRYRIDGVLYDVTVSPEVRNFIAPIISRIKIMANLNIVERRLPQDGRAIVKTQEQPLDLRISTLPTPHGESIVIRILPTKILFSLEKLGLANTDSDILKKLIEKPHGIIFVTGPTGSGKTTTLYACLKQINTRDRKIITLEDPIEYEIGGMTQIQVHPEIGLDFARGLRSVLRHDPDIIMVGEVRDLETAEIAIRVALTGHLIFSTLHTNDAASGITRLIDIGIEPYLIASSVEAFIAQRLVRVICPHCKYEDTTPLPELREAMARQLGLSSVADVKIFRGKGCEHCNSIGFLGRTAIYEILLVDEEIKDLIVKRVPSGEIKKRAKDLGMHTLFEDGLRKIIAGVTTPEEVFRVISSQGYVSGEKMMFSAGQEENLLAERRAYPRLDSKVNVKYKVATAGNKERKGSGNERFVVSNNISAGGIACVIPEEVPVGTFLDLQIDLPDGGNPIRCLGKVARIKKLDSGEYEAGVCFLDLTGGERNRLNKYVSGGLKK
jgi:type II secretory ATPase GspE/PulE/Tfp pilus assembly ATPase PilB-like protein